VQISRGIYAHSDFQSKNPCKLHVKLHIDLMGAIDSYEESPVRLFFGGRGGDKIFTPSLVSFVAFIII